MQSPSRFQIPFSKTLSVRHMEWWSKCKGFSESIPSGCQFSLMLIQGLAEGFLVIFAYILESYV